MWESAEVVVLLIVGVLVPAVGWLVAAVISHGKQLAGHRRAIEILPELRSGLDSHGRQLAELRQAIEVLPELRIELKQLAHGQRDIAVGLEALRGDVKAMSERTGALLRTVERHERWLERRTGDEVDR